MISPHQSQQPMTTRGSACSAARGAHGAWRSMAVSTFLLAALLGSGCTLLPPAAADPTRYYVFNPPEQAPVAVAMSGSRGTTLAIRSIELPAYLRNSKSMVVRVGENEVRYEDYSRWAEPIDAGLQRILKERLANAEGVRSVISFPLAAGETRQMDLRIRVSRCEGNAPRGGQAVAQLVANYQVFDGADGKRLLSAHFSAPALPWDGHDFDELARQLSVAVALLADDIARNLPQH